jgi:hypothetical protein
VLRGCRRIEAVEARRVQVVAHEPIVHRAPAGAKKSRDGWSLGSTGSEWEWKLLEQVLAICSVWESFANVRTSSMQLGRRRLHRATCGGQSIEGCMPCCADADPRAQKNLH